MMMSLGLVGGIYDIFIFVVFIRRISGGFNFLGIFLVVVIVIYGVFMKIN